MSNNLISFVKMSQTSYDALAEKSDTYLYFVQDDNGIGNIYKGDKPFTESIIIVDEFPEANISKGKIYLKTDGIGQVWDGNQWIPVIKPMATGDIVDGETQDTIVTADQIKAYVTDKLANIAVSSAGYSKIELNPTTNELEFYVESDGSETVTKSVPMAAYFTDVTFDKGILSFTVAGSEEKKTLDIKMLSMITNVEYDEATKEIVLTLNTDDSTTCRIPAEDVFSSYTAEGTDTLDLSIDPATLKISGNVKVSAAEGNAVEVKDDGIYVSASAGGGNTVTPDKEGEILTAKADGSYDVSGYTASNEELSDSETQLFTGHSVKKYADDKVINELSTDAPSKIAALSEEKVVDMLSWHEQ